MASEQTLDSQKPGAKHKAVLQKRLAMTCSSTPIRTSNYPKHNKQCVCNLWPRLATNATHNSQVYATTKAQNERPESVQNKHAKATSQIAKTNRKGAVWRRVSSAQQHSTRTSHNNTPQNNTHQMQTKPRTKGLRQRTCVWLSANTCWTESNKWQSRLQDDKTKHMQKLKRISISRNYAPNTGVNNNKAQTRQAHTNYRLDKHIHINAYPQQRCRCWVAIIMMVCTTTTTSC